MANEKLRAKIEEMKTEGRHAEAGKLEGALDLAEELWQPIREDHSDWSTAEVDVMSCIAGACGVG